MKPTIDTSEKISLNIDNPKDREFILEFLIDNCIQVGDTHTHNTNHVRTVINAELFNLNIGVDIPYLYIQPIRYYRETILNLNDVDYYKIPILKLCDWCIKLNKGYLYRKFFQKIIIPFNIHTTVIDECLNKIFPSTDC